VVAPSPSARHIAAEPSHVDVARKRALDPLGPDPPEEVMQLADAADAEQDRVLYITAVFSGLRRTALRWRTVDFDQEALRTGDWYRSGELSRPKAGRARTVPTVEPVEAGGAQAPHAASGSCLPRLRVHALRRADRRALRFHGLRQTFGSLAINDASILPMQVWMGHAEVNTTMRYLHHRSRAGDGRLRSHAFRANGDTADGRARRREGAVNAVAVGLDRDLSLAKVHAQRC